MCASGSTANKTNEEGEPTCGGQTSGDVVYEVTANFTGNASVVMDTPAAFDAVLAGYFTCGGTMDACDNGVDPSLSYTSTTFGETVYLWADGFNGDHGPYDLCVNPPNP